MRAVRVDSRGRRNTLIGRWSDGDDAATEAGARVSGTDPVAGAAVGGVAGGSGHVLGGARSGGED